MSRLAIIECVSRFRACSAPSISSGLRPSPLTNQNICSIVGYVGRSPLLPRARDGPPPCDSVGRVFAGPQGPCATLPASIQPRAATYRECRHSGLPPGRTRCCPIRWAWRPGAESRRAPHHQGRVTSCSIPTAMGAPAPRPVSSVDSIARQCHPPG